MGYPRRVVIVRHAEADPREEGDVDYSRPLTARGYKQAEITGSWLRGRFGNFNARYASYYLRAQETMRIMFPGVESCEDSRLVEISHGISHETLPNDELPIHSFLEKLYREHVGEDILIIGHGRWIILFQRIMDGYSIDRAIERDQNHDVENASALIYERRRVQGEYRLVCLGSVIPWAGKI